MKNTLKIIITFIVSGVLFELLCSGIEYIISKHLRIKTIFFENLKENFGTVLIIYIVICFLLVIMQILYNYLIVKKLNIKLEKLRKKGGGINEK